MARPKLARTRERLLQFKTYPGLVARLDEMAALHRRPRASMAEYYLQAAVERDADNVALRGAMLSRHEEDDTRTALLQVRCYDDLREALETLAGRRYVIQASTGRKVRPSLSAVCEAYLAEGIEADEATAQRQGFKRVFAEPLPSRPMRVLRIKTAGVASGPRKVSRKATLVRQGSSR